MAQKRDYYEVLGVSKDADDRTLRNAYFKLAKQYHPDRNKSPEAQEKFKEATEAYEVLKDPEKRKRYDQFGFAGVDPNSAAGAGADGFSGFGGDFSNFGFSDFGDIFSQFFGGGARSSRQTSSRVKGEDKVIKIRISFMDACLGTTVNIPIDYDETCSSCQGTGAKNGTSFETCPYCHGTGVIDQVRNSIFGQVHQRTVCPHCHGKGKIVKEKCPDCNGEGYKTVHTTIDCKIPAGIEDGSQIRYAGKGYHGYNGGPNGDLYIVVNVAEDKKFRRDGNDIHINVAISALDLMLGGTVTVDTIHGPCDVDIKPGTPVDAVLRLQGMGIKPERKTYSSVGSEYVHFDVKIPTNLTEEEKQALNRVREIEKSKSSSIFDKVKSFFKR